MATSADIAVMASNYQGNAGLGAVENVPIVLDTRPIQQLAQYTFLSNKSEWDQQQKNADAKIDELAKLAAYNPVNGIRKDTQAVIDAKIKLQEAGANYAREFAKDPKQRTEQFVKFKQDIGEAENILNSANSRAIAYQVRKNAILQGAEPAAQKEIQLKALDKEFDETDIYTKISALPNYKVENVEIPKPIPQKIDTVLIGGNENIQVKSTIFNPATNMPEADRVVLGIKNLYPKKGTPEYDQLSDLQKQQADLQGTVESSGKFWGDMSGNFNAVLQAKGADGKPLYFDENGVFLKDKFEDDNASNSVVMRAYNGLKNLDAYSRKKYDEISVKGGIFDDKGIQYALPGNLNSTDFKQGFIDFNKGISPNQLGLAGMFAEYTGDTFDKKVTETDNAIQKATQAETVRNNKADQYLKGRELKLNEDKWKAAQTGGSTQINGAMERAKRIYSDLVKISGKDGIIDPDEIRKLNVEQLKYLGIENVETSETGVPRTVFKPLELGSKEDKSKYAIQLVNGEVRVMKGAEKLPDGRYKGKWDNSKSTNLYNIGTNILNEELKTAGSKELNSYWGIDVTGSTTANTDGGGTTTSGSTKSQTTQPTRTEINRSEIAAKAAEAGYSAKEYEALLKEKGITIKD